MILSTREAATLNHKKVSAMNGGQGMSEADEKHTLAALKRWMSKLPGGPEICCAATDECLADGSEDMEWIKSHFSELVESIQLCAYRKYLEAERPAAARAFREVLRPQLPENPTADDFFDLLEARFFALDKFFLGLTQGRRPRAGNAFEHVIKVLFTKLGYPYTPQPIINGQPDFLMPSLAHYQRNKMDCIIFTVKRSLRERWTQITVEGLRSPLFLATIDEKLQESEIERMHSHNIFLVMPERIRAAKYDQIANVISFEKFFDHYLDPAMSRWRANGVIP